MNQADPPVQRSLPLAQFKHVVAVCDRFEAALRGGEDPDVDDYLEESPEEVRSVLLAELRAIQDEVRAEPLSNPEYVPLSDLDLVDGTRDGSSAESWRADPSALGEDLEILEEIGRGGMGVVYRARQVKLDRIVALKMIHAGSQSDPKYLARFHTEVQAVARLSHPNIVQIYEFGHRQGDPFFAMEFVNGGSLARKLRGGPLPVRQAAEIAETLARAIHAAHQHGIVHRDLKPGNILMALDGQPKITDFGLAKIVSGRDANQSQTGMILGTPNYMAPEQAGSRPAQVGPVTDVYAVGATLYEMLTGSPPFQAATPLETLIDVLGRDPIPPGRLRAKLPRDMETICLKCLEKEPERRYPDAMALADDLHAFLGGAPIRAKPADAWERALHWARRHPARAALATAGALASLGLLFGIWWSDALAVGGVAVLGLLAGICWHHARLQAALREVARQQVAAERYAERLHLLGEMTRRLMTTSDLDRLLYLLGETAARLANAELATIYLVDRQRGELWSKVTLDTGVGEIRIPLGVGIAGTVATSGATIHIPDAYADERFNPEIDLRTGYKTRNLLTFPMTSRNGRIIGVFQVLNKRLGAFEAADEEVLASLAASAAIAVEHARPQFPLSPLPAPRPLNSQDDTLLGPDYPPRYTGPAQDDSAPDGPQR